MTRFAPRREGGFRNRVVDSVTSLAAARPIVRLCASLDVATAGKLIAASIVMAVLLLALFPILLMYRTRWAFAAIALAIVLLYRGKVKTATTRARRRVEEEVYSSDV